MAYAPNCRTDSRVFVNGSRLPVSDVDLHIRNEGALDETRYVEGTFASPWQGEDFLNEFDSIEPNQQSDFDALRVDVLDDATGTYFLAFHGLVTGVGNDASGNERMWSFRAQGPAHILDKIPASETFENATALDVVEYVADELRDRLPFQIAINTEGGAGTGGGGDTPEALTEAVGLDADEQTDTQVQEGATVPEDLTVGGVIDDYTKALSQLQQLSTGKIPEDTVDTRDTAVQGFWGSLGPTLFVVGSVAPNLTDKLHTPKTFEANKHSLADVMDWVARKTEVFTWFDPTPDGVTITMVTDPTGAQHEAHYLGGTVNVINNDALSELKPVNTLIGKGKAARSILEVHGHEINAPTEEFNTAKVRHTPLYKRAGNSELHADVDQVLDAESKSEVEHETKKVLKEAISGATSGSMQSLLRAPITSYDTIRAQPTCDGSVATDAVPIYYEVSRVHHKIRASGTSETELLVGVRASLDDMNVVDEWDPEK